MTNIRKALALGFALVLTAVSMAQADRVGGYGLERTQPSYSAK